MKQGFYSLFWCGLALSATLLISGEMLENTGLSFTQLMSRAGIFCFVISWGLSLFDALRANIPRKQFWLISHLLLPVIAPIIYVSQRKKLLARI